MRRSIWERIQEIINKHVIHGKWVRSVIALSCVVIFITTYVLVMPAVTLSGTPDCGQEEHRHTDDCFETQSEQICGLEEHTHSDDCYDEDGNLICGLEEHAHNDGCYETEEVLTCGMEEHIHTSDCYNGADAEEADSEDSSSSAGDAGEAESKTEQGEDVTDEVNSEDAETVASPEATEAADPEGPAESEEPASGNLLAEGEDYTITVSYTEEANLPADVSLKVEEITNKEEYEGYKSQVEEEILDPESKKVTAARFFDITLLDSEGNELHPEKAVTVVIETKDTLKENEELQVCHFDQEQEKPVIVKSQEIINETYEEDNLGVQFEAETFYVYGIVRTKPIGTTVLTADGETYTVTVSYTEEANLPADVSLKVEEITNTEEYEGYKSQVEEEILDPESKKVTAARFFDITLMDSEGNELHPEKAVTVVIETKDTWKENEEVQVCHFDQEKDKPVIVESQEITNKTYKEDNLGVQFEAESFSVYGIVRTKPIGTTVLTADGETYTVTVSYTEEANLPADVSLKVEEITNTEEYEGYKSQVEEEILDPESKKVTAARFFDITLLDSEGNELHPEKAVTVVIETKDTWKENEEVQVCHFDQEQEKPVIVESQEITNKTYKEDNLGVQFEAESFSVYGIVGTEVIETTYLAADGEKYKITVTCGPEAEIPGNATLSVREIEKETDEYYEYYNKALRAAGLILTDPEYIDETVLPTESTVEVHEMIPFMPDARFFDIRIMVDGEEYEPKAPVEVKVEYDKSLEIGENDTVSSVHFTAEEDELIEAQVSENDEKQVVTHSQDGFSVTGDVVISMTGDADLNNPESKTAKFSDLRAGEQNGGPQTIKTVNDNRDGTYKVRLDIIGEVEHQTKITKANVIVILDTSGSMGETAASGWGWSRSRWDYAEAAVNNVAGTLLGKNGKDGNPNDLVEMALVTFSTTATTQVASTTQASTITDALRGIDPDGGTNWEDALQKAANVNFNNDGDATYVIFVSDGNPTFRNTRGSYNQYFTVGSGWNSYTAYTVDDWHYSGSLGVYGTGAEYDETVRRCYNEALDDAQALVRSGRQLYTIGAFGNVTRMQSLTTGAGAPANHYYSASNADALSTALNEIAEAIENNLGFTDVSTTDGITALSSVSAKVVDGQTTGFKYYKNNVEWADAPTAKFENNAVTWDLSSLEGPLEENTTYSIEFDVWPSQESYDLIADLNNGLRDYNTLPQTTKDQINKNTDGTYTLKTNTSLTTTYTKNGVQDTDEWDKGENSMPLPTEKISIKKIWNNHADEHIGDDSGSVKLYLTKDKRNYLEGENAITVAPGTDTEWVSTKDIFISVGLISQKSDGSYEVREPGHDYSIAEPESFSYYWNLTSDVYRPMSINGTAHYLVLNDAATGTDGEDYYVIEGHKYEVKDGKSELTATNDRRSNLNLTKEIDDKSDDQGADKDTLFNYTITVNNSKASTGSTSNIKSDHYVWFSVYDPVAIVKNLTTNATAEPGNTGYYYVESGSPFTVKLKAGWNLRLLNLPNDTTYTITETVENGWVYEKAEGTGWNYSTEAADDYSINVSKPTVTGNIPDSNHSYTVTVTNKWEPDNSLTVNKTWVSGKYVSNHGTVTVALYKDGEVIEGSVKEIVAPATSVTYDSITSFEGLEVREVTLTTEGSGDEAVTTVTPIEENGLIAVSGETTSLGSNKTDTYVVTYTKGSVSDSSRTDTVTNTMPQLVVNKNDTGNNRLSDAVFKLTGEDGETPLSGYETITSSDIENGNLLNGIYLSNGTYYLVETEAPAGYNKLTYKVKLEVSDNSVVIAAVTDPSSAINIADETSNNKLLYTFTIHNSNGVELPNTGGPGTLPYTLGGIALIMASALMYGFRMRRRERRLN